MVSSHSTSFLLACILQILCFQVVSEPNEAFYFKNFGKDSNFESQLSLYGDAMVADDGMSIQMAGSGAFSGGRIIYKKPINLVELQSGNMVSFSNYFVFSIDNKDGLAFIMLPFGFPLNVFDGGSMGMLGEGNMKFFGVEFDAFKDEMYGDVNGNHVGVDVDSLVSVNVRNVSSINLELSSGEMLQSWIDYEASSKRLELRLSKLGSTKPVDPLISYRIDLSKMWRGESISFGLSSSGKCRLYSWGFRTRTVPHWVHSEPMDPVGFLRKRKEVNVHKRNDCSLRIVGALILGIGCGAMGAFVLFFLWTIFVNRHPVVVPEDFPVQREAIDSKNFEMKTIEDGKV